MGWTEGYVSGVDYLADYYRELNPHAADLLLLAAGFAPPERVTGACCELGFGFGVSANVHAAATGDAWWGTDFNPVQAAAAADLARASGNGARLLDEAFAEFCARTDLPEFDFIGLHGVWSWVSAENRARIVDLLRRRLRLGGLVFMSFNAQPGWAQMVPLRELMAEHAARLSPSGGAAEARVGAALDFAAGLLAASPGFAALHPLAAGRVASLAGMHRSYLAHEYFNRDWHPMLFTAVARALEPAKLSFACSAYPADRYETFNLQPGQAEFLARIPDPVFREAARDIMINRQFRKDYWIKGPRRLAPQERLARLAERRVLLLTPADEVTLRAGGALVERELQGNLYLPVLEALSDRVPRALGEVAARVAGRGVSLEGVVEVALVLLGKGDLAAVRAEADVERGRATARRFNRHVIEASFGEAGCRTLACPVTGGGVTLAPFHLRMLDAAGRGLATPAEWAAFILRELAAKGAGLADPAGGVMPPDRAQAALEADARLFAERRLPLLSALGAV